MSPRPPDWRAKTWLRIQAGDWVVLNGWRTEELVTHVTREFIYVSSRVLNHKERLKFRASDGEHAGRWSRGLRIVRNNSIGAIE